jgi:hypothetical protein
MRRRQQQRQQQQQASKQIQRSLSSLLVSCTGGQSAGRTASKCSATPLDHPQQQQLPRRRTPQQTARRANQINLAHQQPLTTTTTAREGEQQPEIEAAMESRHAEPSRLADHTQHLLLARRCCSGSVEEEKK